MVVEPVPGLRVDGLADARDDAERAEVGLGDVLLAETTEQAHRGRGGVEVRELVRVDRLPEARGGRVDGCRLEDEGSDTVRERAVHEVAVAGEVSV